jgi:hypothetical protein
MSGILLSTTVVDNNFPEILSDLAVYTNLLSWTNLLYYLRLTIYHSSVLN